MPKSGYCPKIRNNEEGKLRNQSLLFAAGSRFARYFVRKNRLRSADQCSPGPVLIFTGFILWKKQKASTWFTSRGLQLPKLVQTIIDANDSIAQKTKSVNTYSMQNAEKDTQIKETDKKTTNQLDKIKNLSYNKDTENKEDRHGGKEETEAGRNAEVQGVSKGDRRLAYNVSGLVRRADHRRTGGVVRLSNNVAPKLGF